MRYYHMAFIPVPEEGFAILSPDFQEIASQGKDLVDCMNMSMDVLNIVSKEYSEARKELPSPCSLAEAKSRVEEMLKELGFEIPVREIIFQMVPAPEADMRPVKISATFPRHTLDMIDLKAKAHGMSRSGFLAAAAQAYGG